MTLMTVESTADYLGNGPDVPTQTTRLGARRLAWQVARGLGGLLGRILNEVVFTLGEDMGHGRIRSHEEEL